MKGYRKILIALNGNGDVLDYGLKLACDEKTWVAIVKVIPPFEGDINLTGIKNIGDALDSGGRRVIREIESAAQAAGAPIKTRLEKGSVSEQILAAAGEERCDLIIMGAPKPKRFRWLLGDRSVEKVIAQSSCPVLVVSA